jgi:hypothetical protein
VGADCVSGCNREGEPMVMTRSETSTPLLYARIAGWLYLMNIACGIFGQIFVRGHLVVPGDAAATAHNILGHELMYRSGIVGDLIMHITDLPSDVLMYVLLRPVNKDLSLLAMVFGLMQTAILCANKLSLVTVLLLLGGVRGFTPEQTAGLASVSLAQHEIGFAVGLIFFGVSCLVTAYLLWRSGYFPRALAVFQAVAGVSYLVNSFTLLMAPDVAATMFPWVVLPAFVGELLTCLYLIVRGMNVRVWEERVGEVTVA